VAEQEPRTAPPTPDEPTPPTNTRGRQLGLVAILALVGAGIAAAAAALTWWSADYNDLIREGKVAQMYSAIQTGSAVGMQTLDQCLLNLITKRVITRESAREIAKIPENF
jgi:twitching motility protein PilT